MMISRVLRNKSKEKVKETDTQGGLELESDAADLNL